MAGVFIFRAVPDFAAGILNTDSAMLSTHQTKIFRWNNPTFFVSKPDQPIQSIGGWWFVEEDAYGPIARSLGKRIVRQHVGYFGVGAGEHPDRLSGKTPRAISRVVLTKISDASLSKT